MPIHPIIDPAAVEGDAPGGLGSGVRGRNSIGEAEGVLGGTDPVLFQPVGVYGMSSNQGVVGLSKGDGAGVLGSNNSNGLKGRGVQGNGPEAGVGGFSEGGTGVLGQSTTGSGVVATSRDGQGVSTFSTNDIAIFASEHLHGLRAESRFLVRSFRVSSPGKG